MEKDERKLEESLTKETACEEGDSPKTKLPRQSPHILVILGHPRSESLCGELARSYVKGAKSSGAEVEFVQLNELKFEVHLNQSSPVNQALEPDLHRLAESIKRCDHLVLVYPVWWASMPALLKGFWDRILMPGFAFSKAPGSLTGYRKELTGRTGELIITMDTPAWAYHGFYQRIAERTVKQGILGFCGIQPTKVTRFHQIDDADTNEVEGMIEEARKKGASATTWKMHQSARSHKLAWISVVRLQFYAMTLLSYGMGSLAVSHFLGSGFSWPIFFTGFLALFLLELAAVFINEVYDQGTDAINKNAGPFNGGSQVLPQGRLSPKRVLSAARAAYLFSLALMTFLILLNPRLEEMRLMTGGWVLSGYFLAPFYTLPPFKLSYRGWGELVVAFTHSIFMVMTGWLLQGGSISHDFPYLISLPLFFSILSAITLAGIPDQTADAAVKKNTLAVKLSSTKATWLAATFGVIALGSISFLIFKEPIFSRIYRPLFLTMNAVHLFLLIYLLNDFLRKGAPCKRIDLILFTALAYILWFCVRPLAYFL